MDHEVSLLLAFSSFIFTYSLDEWYCTLIKFCSSVLYCDDVDVVHLLYDISVIYAVSSKQMID